MPNVLKLGKPLIIDSFEKDGKKITFNYYACDSFDLLPYKQCTQVSAIALDRDQMVIIKNGKKNTWNIPGGTIEKGETFEQTLKRELQEETNVNVIKWKPIGFQQVIEDGKEPYFQLRTAAIVKPFGPFVSDPAGSVTEIKWINPKDFGTYVTWGDKAKVMIDTAIMLIQKMGDKTK